MALKITSIKEAPKRLDPSRPYQQGMSSVHGKYYVQDGVKYRLNGKQFNIEDPAPTNGAIESPQYLRARTGKETGPVSLRMMHWTELRGLMHSFGEEYVSADEAIRYLEGVGM